MKNNAVSETLFATILELQKLDSLKNFALGGGTNCAIRYNHRISIDIDLFCSAIIGIKGFENIENELKEFYGDKLISFTYPTKQNDQFIFARCLINNNSEFIKLEILQNSKRLRKIEKLFEAKLLSDFDIGIMKLLAVSDRMSKKDVYDLDFITDRIPLIELYKGLIIKEETYPLEEHRTIFDLNNSLSPTKDISLLLAFDKLNYQSSNSKPNHSDDNLLLLSESKNWFKARASWRKKVRQLYNELGMKFPKPKGIDV